MTVATKTKVDLDQLRRRETDLAEQVEATRGRLSQYSTLIAEARREAVYAGKARPGGELGGSVRKLTDKERADANALSGLEGDLSAVRSVIAVEAQRQVEEDQAEAREQLAVLHEQELVVWEKAGSQLAELAATWNNLVNQVELEARLASTSGIAPPGVLAVEPVPATFKSFLLLLHEAATDPAVREEPFAVQPYDGAPARFEEVRRRLDEDDRLVHLVPDLRAVVRALGPLGHVPTRG